MNIIISGAMGAMGQVVASNAAARGITVVAGVDREASDRFPYPVFGVSLTVTFLPMRFLTFPIPPPSPACWPLRRSAEFPV